MSAVCVNAEVTDSVRGPSAVFYLFNTWLGVHVPGIYDRHKVKTVLLEYLKLLGARDVAVVQIVYDANCNVVASQSEHVSVDSGYTVLTAAGDHYYVFVYPAHYDRVTAWVYAQLI